MSFCSEKELCQLVLSVHRTQAALFQYWSHNFGCCTQFDFIKRTSYSFKVLMPQTHQNSGCLPPPTLFSLIYKLLIMWVLLVLIVCTYILVFMCIAYQLVLLQRFCVSFFLSVVIVLPVFMGKSGDYKTITPLLPSSQNPLLFYITFSHLTFLKLGDSGLCYHVCIHIELFCLKNMFAIINCGELILKYTCHTHQRPSSHIPRFGLIYVSQNHMLKC